MLDTRSTAPENDPLAAAVLLPCSLWGLSMTDLQAKLLVIVFDKGLITIAGGGLLLLGTWLVNRSLDQHRHHNARQLEEERQRSAHMLESMKVRQRFALKLHDALGEMKVAVTALMAADPANQAEFFKAKERFVAVKQAAMDTLEANRGFLDTYAGDEWRMITVAFWQLHSRIDFDADPLDLVERLGGEYSAVLSLDSLLSDLCGVAPLREREEKGSRVSEMIKLMKLMNKFPTAPRPPRNGGTDGESMNSPATSPLPAPPHAENRPPSAPPAPGHDTPEAVLGPPPRR